MWWFIGGFCVLCGVLVIAANMRSSQFSQQQRDADAWREEYARVTRLRDGVGRR